MCELSFNVRVSFAANSEYNPVGDDRYFAFPLLEATHVNDTCVVLRVELLNEPKEAKDMPAGEFYSMV